MEHESALRGCVDWVSLNVCQHSSCTSVHILCTLANVVTSALAQLFSKTVIHGIESHHSFNLVLVYLLSMCLLDLVVTLNDHSHDSVDPRLLNFHLRSELRDSAVLLEEAVQQAVAVD